MFSFVFLSNISDISKYHLNTISSMQLSVLIASTVSVTITRHFSLYFDPSIRPHESWKLSNKRSWNCALSGLGAWFLRCCVFEPGKTMKASSGGVVVADSLLFKCLGL